MSVIPEPYERAVPAQRVRLRSGEVAYRRAGSGPPLLLLHGWGGSSNHWQTTLQDLATIRTVYALDLPGYGESPPLVETSTAERLAQCVIDFAEAMQLDRFDINGHSMGGAVAIYVAARHPEQVQRLIVSCYGTFTSFCEEWTMAQLYVQLSLAMHFWNPWLVLATPWQRLGQLWMQQAGYVPGVPWVVARPFFYQMPMDGQLLHDGYQEFVSMDQRTSMESVISLGNPALRAAMEQVRAPTLLVGARQDMVVNPERIEQAARIIPHCRVAWIDDCGHVPIIEQPFLYHHVLHAFLEEESRGARALVA